MNTNTNINKKMFMFTCNADDFNKITHRFITNSYETEFLSIKKNKTGDYNIMFTLEYNGDNEDFKDSFISNTPGHHNLKKCFDDNLISDFPSLKCLSNDF